MVNTSLTKHSLISAARDVQVSSIVLIWGLLAATNDATIVMMMLMMLVMTVGNIHQAVFASYSAKSWALALT